MNVKHQEIINSFINELNRIEDSRNQNKGFNLINIDSLNEKTNEIQRFKEEAIANKQAWDDIANEEAIRLVKLFQEDLPNACVQKYGKDTGHYDLPSLMIRRNENSSKHYQDCVSIEVKILTETIRDSFGNPYSKGLSLAYRFNYDRNEFNTIEELVKDSTFLESIRTRVL
jgi:hypothetical protein